MAKVFLGVGHGGSDPGSVGYLKEADVNLSMALACRDYLEANGVKVMMSRTKDENDLIGEVIRECNVFGPDLAVDIHNNSGGGNGFECYYHYKGGTSKTLAENIEAAVKAIGQNSRGCKIRRDSAGKDYYAFIRQTNCPAVISEGAFVDNAADAAQIDTLQEQRNFGIAYAKGILKTLGIADKNSGKGPTASAPSQGTGPWYRVGTGWRNGKCLGQTGAYRNLQYAVQSCKVGQNVYDEQGNIVYRGTASARA